MPLRITQERLLVAMGLLTYLFLCALTVRDVGVVGEVAAAWLDEPPSVLLTLDDGAPLWSGPPDEPHAASRLGPFEARWTRPTESLVLGAFRLPLAVNAYTGGLPEWPARLLLALGAAPRALVGLHVALGFLLLLTVRDLAARLRSWSELPFDRAPPGPSLLAPGLATCLLATEWSFVYYRKVLGGTEIALLLAGLLLLRALSTRRLSSGPWPTRLLGVAVGLGLLAKATFISTLLAFLLASLLLPRRPGPSPRSFRPLLEAAGIAALLISPLLLSLAHHLFSLPGPPPIRSHDSLALQGERLASGLGAIFGGVHVPARESFSNLFYFLFEPLRWFPVAHGRSELTPPWNPLRWLAFAFLMGGVLLAWIRRAPEDLATRFLSTALTLQLLFLQLANRDLHHLAQATPTLALCTAFSLTGLASALARRLGRPTRAVGLACLLCFPALAGGTLSLRLTDTLLATLPTPTFTERGQTLLLEMLARHEVGELWTSDYDPYGMLEARAPEIRARHLWGLISVAEDPRARLPDLLGPMKGAFYLVLRPSAPMIYNFRPSPGDLQRAAASQRLELEEVDHLDDARGNWARLYAVRAVE